MAIKKGRWFWSGIRIKKPGAAPVARGLAPVRLRSSRKTYECGVPDEM
jgi:hypothetical protein